MPTDHYKRLIRYLRQTSMTPAIDKHQQAWRCNNPCCEKQPDGYSINEEEHWAYCDECGQACTPIEQSS